MESARALVPLVISFTDLTRYSVNAARALDVDVARILDGWYERVGERAQAGGGRVVKFIGDAALVVFPLERADDAVEALMALREEARGYFRTEGWDCEAVVKVHCGEVVAGPYGLKGDKRFDVIGTAVNVTARVASRGFAMTPEAFRKLSPAMRKRVKKHTPPVTYIGLDDERPC